MQTGKVQMIVLHLSSPALHGRDAEAHVLLRIEAHVCLLVHDWPVQEITHAMVAPPVRQLQLGKAESRRRRRCLPAPKTGSDCSGRCWWVFFQQEFALVPQGKGVISLVERGLGTVRYTLENHLEDPTHEHQVQSFEL